MKFVLFHGAFGSPDENWFPQLREKLEAVGQEVVVPKFPVDNWKTVTKLGPSVAAKHQKLQAWMSEFGNIKQNLIKEEKLCFIGHSLGPLFILHAVEHFNIQLDSAIFVSPFFDRLNRSWQIDHVNESFYKTDFDFEKLKKLIPVSYVLYSDNDPYVDRNHSILFAKALDSSLIYVKRAGHMNSETNLNEFPLVFDLCTTRLDLSLYQRYIAHSSNRLATEYIRKRKEGKVYLDPSEVADEGMFHFRNLGKEGFCTFWTAGTSYWDPDSPYMTEARRAAQRIKKFVRVFVVDKKDDLSNPVLMKQMTLDVAAGISVYLCWYKDIQDHVAEPDFGIWDNDYVCTVRFGKKPGKVQEIELSSKAEDLSRAEKWKQIIFTKSQPVTNVEKDIKQFLKSKV